MFVKRRCSLSFPPFGVNRRCAAYLRNFLQLPQAPSFTHQTGSGGFATACPKTIFTKSTHPRPPNAALRRWAAGGNHKNSIFVITNNHSCASCPISPLLYGLRTVCSHALSKPSHPIPPNQNSLTPLRYRLTICIRIRSVAPTGISYSFRCPQNPPLVSSFIPLCKSLYID